jgi:hypothetical protein
VYVCVYICRYVLCVQVPYQVFKRENILQFPSYSIIHTQVSPLLDILREDGMAHCLLSGSTVLQSFRGRGKSIWVSDLDLFISKQHIGVAHSFLSQHHVCVDICTGYVHGFLVETWILRSFAETFGSYHTAEVRNVNTLVPVRFRTEYDVNVTYWPGSFPAQSTIQLIVGHSGQTARSMIERFD